MCSEKLIFNYRIVQISFYQTGTFNRFFKIVLTVIRFSMQTPLLKNKKKLVILKKSDFGKLA
ncbi:MAG TPA: hypothetical protein DHV48_15495 [Prolixibacteraceae bacterium]|nr:MAG: hypothetical protein A2066_01635 [Bacteroidetes bacterium GWB2_41_8]HCY42730.1 hypothetical protein [Prolixibacteraceae bacterium]